MPIVEIPFCGPAYTSDSLNINAQRTLNWYPEINPSDSKVVVALKPTPGLKLFTSLTGGGVLRGLYTTSGNRFFGVCGNILSEISTDGTATVRGTINSNSSSRVRMKDNGIDLIIVDGSTSQGFTLILASNVFSQITDSAYPGGSHVDFINQRYLMSKPNTQRYYWSALADGTSWDAGQVASAESSPDKISAHIALGGEEWLFGPQSYEVAYNTDGDPVFARLQGTPTDIGIAAPDSLTRSDVNLFWLGGDDNGQGKVFMNEGYRARRISTHAIEQAIQRYSKIDDAIGYCYQQLGHDFYVLSFPTASVTWVFDQTTGMWHERDWRDSNNVSYMHRGIVQDFYNDSVMLGDWGNNKVYQLDPDTYTDEGQAIHRERTSPHIWNNLERAYYGSFQVDLETGIGLTGDVQGSNPQIMRSISNDGAHTFPPEMNKWRSAGKKGEYKTRVKWDRNGSSRDRVFRIQVTDPVKWVILGAYVEVE